MCVYIKHSHADFAQAVRLQRSWSFLDWQLGELQALNTSESTPASTCAQ